MEDTAKEVKKINDKIIQDSFNTSFYNDAFKRLDKISSDFSDNPAQIQMEADAYINGTASSLPKDEAEKIVAPLIEAKNAYAQQAEQNFNSNQLKMADEKSAYNTIASKEMAENAIKRSAPEKIQLTLASNFLSQVDEDVKMGRLTRNQGVSLIRDYGQNAIVNHLGDILNDKSMSAKQQLEWIRRFADGKTGDDFIDKSMTPIDRANAVNMAMNNASQLESFEEKKRQAAKQAGSDAWMDFYVNSAKVASKLTDFYELQEMQNKLMDSAQTPEQFKLASGFIENIDKKSNAFAKVELDKALRDGVLTKDVVLSAFNARVLSTEDFTNYMKTLDEPLSINKSRDVVQVALAEARKSYGYTPFGQNNAYDTFVANLEAKMTSEVLNGTQLSTAIRDSFAETDKLYPKAAQATVKRIEGYGERYGVSIEKVTEEINTSAREIATQMAGGRATKVTGEIMAKAQHQALLRRAEQWMKENNKTQQDFNQFVQDYKDISGGQ